MSISALNAGLSGMQSYQRALDVSGHNVANSLTNGFTPQTIAFQEAAPAGNGATALPSSPTPAVPGSQAASGTDLANETVNQLTYKFGFDLSAKVVQTADQMLGTLIDTKA